MVDKSVINSQLPCMANQEAVCDYSALLAYLYKEMKEVNFLLSNGRCTEEPLPTNPCPPGIKNQQDFPFYIIIKAKHKTEGITHSALR